jgi:hypothetical protein
MPLDGARADEQLRADLRISLAFALNGVNTDPYQQTMAATKGPDVVAQSGNDPYTGVTSPADLAALMALNHAQGVTAHSGPYPIVGDTGPVGPVLRSTDLVASVHVPARIGLRRPVAELLQAEAM